MTTTHAYVPHRFTETATRCHCGESKAVCPAASYDRFLIAGGPDECRYEIRNGVYRLATFVTAGVNGRTPDETAEANLADYSEHYTGARLSLWRMKNEVETDELLCEAAHGCVFPREER